MKKILFVLAFSFVVSTASLAADRTVGVGIILGEPTGISIKKWTGSTTAFDLGLAWSLGGNNEFHIHGDYLWHNYSVFKVDSGKLPLYYGIGLRARLATDTQVGVRGVIGLAYIFAEAPIDIFLEIAPVMDLIPGTAFGFNGAIGARFFF